MVVHPGNGNHNGTLVNGLVYHFNKLSDRDVSRPGIIHRLDKDTTGILVVAKNNHAHDFISEQFANRKIYKEYEAIVWGEVAKEGIVEGLIGRDKNNRILFKMVENNLREKKLKKKNLVIALLIIFIIFSIYVISMIRMGGA